MIKHIEVPKPIWTHPMDADGALYWPLYDHFTTLDNEHPIKRRDVEGRKNIEVLTEWAGEL